MEAPVRHTRHVTACALPPPGRTWPSAPAAVSMISPLMPTAAVSSSTSVCAFQVSCLNILREAHTDKVVTLHALCARTHASRAHARPPDTTGWYGTAHDCVLHTWRAAAPLVIASAPPPTPCPENLSRHSSCARERHMKPLGQGGRPMWGCDRTPSPKGSAPSCGS